MIGITLSPEQMRAAPPEVRRWIEKELASSLGFLAQVDRQSHPARSELAVCAREEALGIFELIKGDYLTCQVFFELGRGADDNESPYQLHALSIAEIMRHTRIHSTELQRSLTVINQALQQLRRDPNVSLFGFDEEGHCYVHRETHRSIGQLWQEFVTSQMQKPLHHETGVASPQVDVAHNEPQPRQAAQVYNETPAAYPGVPNETFVRGA
jgi:hypothetical protein